jgi:hypothetical protein
VITSVAAIDGIEKLDADALRAFGELVESLGWTEEHGDHLASVIALESRFDPRAVNPSSKATGLIQWLPSTARRHGTTVEAIREMTAAQQLELMRSYFEPFRGVSPRDIAIAVLMPNDRNGGSNIGASDDKVIAQAGEPAYDLNAGLDIGADGLITLGDVRQSYAGPLFKAKDRPRVELPARPRIWLWLLGAAVLAGGAYWAYVRATDQQWDGPIRALMNSGASEDVNVIANPSRAAWKRVRQITCGRERKQRRRLGREWADRPCNEERAKLREEASQEAAERAARSARATPKQKRAQRQRRAQQLEHIEREAGDLERHLEQHSELPGVAIAEAVRQFKKDPWPFFRRSKRVGGRTHPYEFAAEDAIENEGDLIESGQRYAEREVRRLEREREEEIPF